MYIYEHLRIHCPLREREGCSPAPPEEARGRNRPAPPPRPSQNSRRRRTPSLGAVWAGTSPPLSPPPPLLRSVRPAPRRRAPARLPSARPGRTPPPVRHQVGSESAVRLRADHCWYLTLEGMHSSHPPPGTRGIDAVCHTRVCI